VSEAVEKSWFGERRRGLLLVDCGLKGKAEGKEDVECKGVWQRYSSRHLTIHNAVDIASIDRILAPPDGKRLRRDLGLEDCVVVGTVARLSHEKGVDILVKAFASVHRRNPAARLLIVGDGQERAALVQLSHDLGLESDVVWAGAQVWEKAMQHLSLMDVVVVPSRYEGFGLTVVEAMACSKPVVASNLDGISEVIGSDAPGTLASPGDIEAMAGAIASFLGSAELRKNAGLYGRQRVEKTFGFELFAKRWREVYQAVGVSRSDIISS